MTQALGQWLDLAARVKAEWGVGLFVVVSYTFVCLWTISQVRAVRLDRNYNPRVKDLSGIQVRALSVLIAAPVEFLIAMLWGIPFNSALMHALLAGISTPVVAACYIKLLRWRGCDEMADLFTVNRKRRVGDPDPDESAERYL